MKFQMRLGPSFVAICYLFGQVLAAHHAHVTTRQISYSNYHGPIVPSFNISIPIDHFGGDVGTYNNRYWVNDTYYEPGGPVFFYDNGKKGIGDEYAAQILAEINGTTAVMALARHYNGLAILWEHRYYGKSLPFPLNKSHTNTRSFIGYEPEGAPESFKYLTVDQALEDVVYFAHNLSLGEYQRTNMSQLSPTQVPWIWLGGSYAGMRGAWLRIRNPETIYAAWSSSSPVQAMLDGHTYYDGALRSLPKNCSADTLAIVPYLDEIISGKHGNDMLLNLQLYFYVSDQLLNNDTYDLSSPNVTESLLNPYDIAVLLAQPFGSLFQSFGPTFTTRVFCDALETYQPGAAGTNTNDTYANVLTNLATHAPSSDGILASNSHNLSLGLEAYVFALRKYQDYYFDFLIPASSHSGQYISSSSADASAWQYQSSTELSAVIGSDPNNITIISRLLNTSAPLDNTVHYLLSNATINALPAQPNLNATNKYGGWHMNPTNTMFTDGEFDPWLGRSLFSPDSELGAPGYTPTDQVPDCGKLPANGTRFGVIYPGAVHVPDLLSTWWEPSGTGSPLDEGLKLFTKALDVWLLCFGKEGANGNTTAGQNGSDAASGKQSTSGAARINLFDLPNFCFSVFVGFFVNLILW